MLSQMDPALVAFCERIAAEGGPMPVPDELAGSSFPTTTVVQLASVTRASARLRNVQPDVNLDQSYEALKRPKKNVDAAHAGIVAFRFLSQYRHVVYLVFENTLCSWPVIFLCPHSRIIHSLF